MSVTVNVRVSFRLFLSVLFVLASGQPSTAVMPTSPGFDCKLARTPIEREMCSDEGISYAWLDKTMADLFDIVRKSKTDDERIAMVAEQRRWLLQRNACDDENKRLDTCLPDAYDRRFSAIAARYGESDMTGIYRNDAGTLQSVVFPDKTFVFKIEIEQGYKACLFTGRGVFVDGQLHYQEEQDPKINLGSSSCRVVIQTAGTALSVKSDGCDSYCGAFLRIDGNLKKAGGRPSTKAVSKQK